MSPSAANRRIPVKSQNVEVQRTSVVLPGYRFIRQLGHGAQGDVYLAERESDGLKVAIKKLNIGSVKNWKEYELFHREAEVLSSLDIDGISKFYDAVDRLEDNPPCSYIIQEYIDGRSMAEMLKNGHRFSIDQIYDMIMQLLDILHKLHTHEPPVIHRDIKPSNILLKALPRGGYQVYLIDFGAVANPQVQSGGSTVAGTYGYMPPEQLMGKPEPASDIYALAAVSIYLFTGKSPADMEQKDFHLIFEPEMQSFPVEVVNTLRSMLEPDPKKRLCDYEDLYKLFLAFQQGCYALTGSRRTSMSLDEYDRKLREVMIYGADGNFELWQELDDHLPRESNILPPSYLSLAKTDRNHDEYHFHKFADFRQSSLNKSPNYIPWTKKIGLGIVSYQEAGMILGGLFFILLLIFMNVPISEDTRNAIIGLSVALSLISHPVLSIWLYHRNINRIITSDNTIDLASNRFELSQNNIALLLSRGRKTIATIISIEYMKVHDEFVESNTADANRFGRSQYARYSIHRSPLFKIRYSFNPPDDAQSQDLIHEICTHIDPEHHYKVGDPFPILYRIYHANEVEHVDSKPNPEAQEDGGDNNIYLYHANEVEYVDSMPFPAPLEDVFNNNNIFYHDKYLFE